MVFKITTDMVLFTVFLCANLRYAVFFTGVYLIFITSVTLGFTTDGSEVEMLTNRFAIGTTVIFMWYILQRRELQRFFQQRKLEIKERQAVTKQMQTSSVLEL